MSKSNMSIMSKRQKLKFGIAEVGRNALQHPKIETERERLLPSSSSSWGITKTQAQALESESEPQHEQKHHTGNRLPVQGNQQSDGHLSDQMPGSMPTIHGYQGMSDAALYSSSANAGMDEDDLDDMLMNLATLPRSQQSMILREENPASNDTGFSRQKKVDLLMNRVHSMTGNILEQIISEQTSSERPKTRINENSPMPSHRYDPSQRRQQRPPAASPSLDSLSDYDDSASQDHINRLLDNQRREEVLRTESRDRMVDRDNDTIGRRHNRDNDIRGRRLDRDNDTRGRIVIRDIDARDRICDRDSCYRDDEDGHRWEEQDLDDSRDSDARGRMGDRNSDERGRMNVRDRDARGRRDERDSDARGRMGDTDRDARARIGDRDRDARGRMGDTDSLSRDDEVRYRWEEQELDKCRDTDTGGRRGDSDSGARMGDRNSDERGRMIIRDRDARGRRADRDNDARGGMVDRNSDVRGRMGDRDSDARGRMGDRDCDARGRIGDRDSDARGRMGDRDSDTRGRMGDRDSRNRDDVARHRWEEQDLDESRDSDARDRSGDRDSDARGRMGDRDSEARGRMGDRDSDARGRIGDRDRDTRGRRDDRDSRNRDDEARHRWEEQESRDSDATGGRGDRDSDARGRMIDRDSDARGRMGDRDRDTRGKIGDRDGDARVRRDDTDSDTRGRMGERDSDERGRMIDRNRDARGRRDDRDSDASGRMIDRDRDARGRRDDRDIHARGRMIDRGSDAGGRMGDRDSDARGRMGDRDRDTRGRIGDRDSDVRGRWDDRDSDARGRMGDRDNDERGRMINRDRDARSRRDDRDSDASGRMIYRDRDARDRRGDRDSDAGGRRDDRDSHERGRMIDRERDARGRMGDRDSDARGRMGDRDSDARVRMGDRDSHSRDDKAKHRLDESRDSVNLWDESLVRDIDVRSRMEDEDIIMGISGNLSQDQDSIRDGSGRSQDLVIVHDISDQDIARDRMEEQIQNMHIVKGQIRDQSRDRDIGRSRTVDRKSVRGLSNQESGRRRGGDRDVHRDRGRDRRRGQDIVSGGSRDRRRDWDSASGTCDQNSIRGRSRSRSLDRNSFMSRSQDWNNVNTLSIDRNQDQDQKSYIKSSVAIQSPYIISGHEMIEQWRHGSYQVAAPVVQPYPAAAPVVQPYPAASPLAQAYPAPAPVSQAYPVAASVSQAYPVAASVSQAYMVAALDSQPYSAAASVTQPYSVAMPDAQPYPAQPGFPGSTGAPIPHLYRPPQPGVVRAPQPETLRSPLPGVINPAQPGGLRPHPPRTFMPPASGTFIPVQVGGGRMSPPAGSFMSRNPGAFVPVQSEAFALRPPLPREVRPCPPRSIRPHPPEALSPSRASGSAQKFTFGRTRRALIYPETDIHITRNEPEEEKAVKSLKSTPVKRKVDTDGGRWKCGCGNVNAAYSVICLNCKKEKKQMNDDTLTKPADSGIKKPRVDHDIQQNVADPAPLIIPQPSESELMKNFRLKKLPWLALKDMRNHLVEFAQDQLGSQLIKKQLTITTPSITSMVFKEVFTSAQILIPHPYGNFVIQKILEVGNTRERLLLAKCLRNQMRKHSVHPHASQVIHKCLGLIPSAKQIKLLLELAGHVGECAKNKYASPILQKSLQCVDLPYLKHIQFIIETIKEQVLELSRDVHGCKVIHHALRYCTKEKTLIIAKIAEHFDELVRHKYGCQVVQAVLWYRNQVDNSDIIIKKILERLTSLSMHKLGHIAVLTCVKYLLPSQISNVLEKLCLEEQPPQSWPLRILTLIRHPIASSVALRLIEVGRETDYPLIFNALRMHMFELEHGTEVGRKISAKLQALILQQKREARNLLQRQHSRGKTAASKQVDTKSKDVASKVMEDVGSKVMEDVASKVTEMKIQNRVHVDQISSKVPAQAVAPPAQTPIVTSPVNVNELLKQDGKKDLSNVKLTDVIDRVVEFSQEEDGSRFIQEKLKGATHIVKGKILKEVLASALTLVMHVYGHRVFQTLFEVISVANRRLLAKCLTGHMYELSLSEHASQVLHTSLSLIPRHNQLELIHELDGHIMECIKNQYASHIIQKAVECIKPQHLQFIIDAIKDQAKDRACIVKHLKKEHEDVSGGESKRKAVRSTDMKAFCVEMSGEMKRTIKVLVPELLCSMLSGPGMPLPFLAIPCQFLAKLLPHIACVGIDRTIKSQNPIVKVTVQVWSLSTDAHACKVILNIIQYCNEDQKTQVIAEIIQHFDQLVCDKQGLCIIQHVLKYASNEDKSKVIKNIIQRFDQFVCDAQRMFVIQTMLKYASKEDKPIVIKKMLTNLATLREDKGVDVNHWNRRLTGLKLTDLTNHIAEFAQDQLGSRFIMEKLMVAKLDVKSSVFTEVLASARSLMMHDFGHILVQKFIKTGSAAKKRSLGYCLIGHMYELSRNEHASQIIHRCLALLPSAMQLELIREFDGHVIECIKNQYSSYIIQKALECIGSQHLQFIIDAIKDQILDLSTDAHAWKVILNVLQYCTPKQKAPVIAEIDEHSHKLICDRYGSRVVQRLLEYGSSEDGQNIITLILDNLFELSLHIFARIPILTCVHYLEAPQLSKALAHLCLEDDDHHSDLLRMTRHPTGIYIAERFITMAHESDYNVILTALDRDTSELKHGSNISDEIIDKLQSLIDEIRSYESSHNKDSLPEIIE